MLPNPSMPATVAWTMSEHPEYVDWGKAKVALDGWMYVLKSHSCQDLPRNRAAKKKWQYALQASNILLLFLTGILQGTAECRLHQKKEEKKNQCCCEELCIIE